MKAALSRNTAILTVSNIGGAALSFLLIVLIGRVLENYRMHKVETRANAAVR